MIRNFVTSIGAVVALLMCSMASIAAPPGEARAEVIHLITCGTVDFTYEYAIDFVGTSHDAMTAELVEHRMPSLSASLAGDTGTTSIPATLVSQEAGVSTAGTEPAGVTVEA